MVHSIADIFLGVFYTFVAVFYTVLIKSRSAEGCGSRMVHPGEPYRLHWWNHLVFRIMRILIWVFCVSRLFFPSVDTLAFIFPIADFAGLRVLGLFVLTGGFALAVSGNFSLRAAWRSGIDPAAPAVLKQTGLYGRSRNPIYVGVALGQVGFFLSLPSGFTLFCLVVGITSLNLQIHLEERYLGERFKETFRDYCRIVPRWI